MGDKMTCPSCDSHTSGILAAYRDGQPCPVCGLSPEATAQIEAIQDSRANDAAKQIAEDAIKRADKAEREASLLRTRLHKVEDAVQSALKWEPV